MAKVMGFRVPDELAQRLEPHKRRISVSAVCREALEQRIAEEEAADELVAASSDPLDGLISRLQIDRKIGLARDKEHGAADGRAWAVRDASYDDLLTFGQAIVRVRRPYTPEELYNPSEYESEGEPLVLEEFPATATSYIDERATHAGQNGRSFDRQAYEAAFLHAVRDIWERVKERLEIADANQHIGTDNKEVDD